jgi:hypothetical protein
MKKIIPGILVLVILLAAPGPAISAAPAAAWPTFLYKTTFVRAAPGKLLDLIALYKSRAAVEAAAGDEHPLWWRHAEGDQWDLMLLSPMGSYTEYYAKERLDRRARAAAAAAASPQEFLRQLAACTAWTEDVFVWGPPLDAVKAAFAAAGYFHLEIFIALPGRQEELYREREMDNAYQVGIGRPAAMIFVRDQGATWDVFSLGCYKDLKEWAELGVDLSKDQKDAAARKAGFTDAASIGPTMRTLIDMHRDTIGGAIK